jgi:single-strand DNA-binding protein
MPDNTVTVIGNITRDPELRFTSGGQAIASLGLAVKRVWHERRCTERTEQVSFFDVKCWAQLGENVAQSLHKGARVIVSGRLEQQSWERDGQKHSKIEIVADEVGPSLRWATANIERNERREGGGFDSGSSHPAQNEPAPAGGGYANDEEPF